MRRNSEDYGGAFTMFPSKAVKEQYFQQPLLGSVITSAFAHIAIVPIYYISSLCLKASDKLHLTGDMLAGIFSGTIKYWNDTQIQDSNQANRWHLPGSRIRLVVRDTPCDANAIMSRFLSSKSNGFAMAYGLSSGEGSSHPQYSVVLDRECTELVSDDVSMDSSVTFIDNSIGYWLQIGVPNSDIAVSPSDVASILNCMSDKSTAINISSAKVMSFYLLTSNASGCYPVVDTVDYPVAAGVDETCSVGSRGVAHRRVQFSSWLYSSPLLTQPLVGRYAGGLSDEFRITVYRDMCNVQCNTYLGYDYCGYRDCSWDEGDYHQTVSSCDSEGITDFRTVSYSLIDGTNNCIRNPEAIPPITVRVGCD
mmetsp:Transcript_20763/g.20862  ORF Transcript_20763/g.20862 Transcript_20763/m.20862 type:complete len:365 (+) Transcript_20763:2181-3275(+)|eukprot:CAMPEP_0182416852 /NCGR_PEP_ID=MMETSP1167-20130531/1234_1 /TAXON_ID=2988 /ORGANISM="Mallomonas Sp, Strain CCMP3275" /LENGTH=364 /DNA_ID=CAMNT_0024589975 /DNA_START=2172 /DNA_END=3266 /DNA_ORIENTATION=-